MLHSSLVVETSLNALIVSNTHIIAAQGRLKHKVLLVNKVLHGNVFRKNIPNGVRTCQNFEASSSAESDSESEFAYLSKTKNYPFDCIRTSQPRTDTSYKKI